MSRAADGLVAADCCCVPELRAVCLSFSCTLYLVPGMLLSVISSRGWFQDQSCSLLFRVVDCCCCCCCCCDMIVLWCFGARLRTFVTAVIAYTRMCCIRRMTVRCTHLWLLTFEYFLPYFWCVWCYWMLFSSAFGVWLRLRGVLFVRCLLQLLAVICDYGILFLLYERWSDYATV